MFKRTLGMLLTLIMVLSMMPLSVLASDTYTVSFDLGYGTQKIKGTSKNQFPTLNFTIQRHKK